MTGSLVALLAVAVALVATSTATYWTLIAWGGLVSVVFLALVLRSLAGRNGIWERSPTPTHSAGVGQLYLALEFKGLPALRLARIRPEFICEVRDPLGARRLADYVQGGGTVVYCAYPQDFSAAPAPQSGVYLVTWKERKQPGAGRWYLMDVYCVTVLL